MGVGINNYIPQQEVAVVVRLTAAFTMAVVIACVTATTALAHMSNIREIKLINKRVEHTHHYQYVGGHPLTKFWGAANKCHHRGCYKLNAVRLYRWTQRDIRARDNLRLPPAIVADLSCLHSHEGAWNDATGNGYYGGLQFLPSTWFSTVSTYHLTFSVLPNVLPPISQMIVAYDRYLEDGGSWREWSTATMCGLS